MTETGHASVAGPGVELLRRLDYDRTATAAGDVGIWHGGARGDGLMRLAARGVKGLELARAGHHAAAVRILRVTVGALGRRGASAYAARAAMSLGRLLLERGRTEAAQQAFADARGLFLASRWIGGVIEAAAFIGLALTDAGRLIEAEASLRATRIAAMACHDPELGIVTRLGLARCLIWQGRRREAEALVEQVTETTSYQRVIVHRLASRLALAKGRVEAAERQASTALALVPRAGRLVDQCGACADMAAVQGALGRVELVRHYSDCGLRAARRAHAPVRAARLRIVLIEELVRAGRFAEARPLAVRLGRWTARLPPMVRARAELALGSSLRSGARAAARRARAFARAHGAGGLVIRHEERPPMQVIRDVIDVLTICQETDDERTALEKVCDVVRVRTGAATVALLVADRAADPLAWAGRPVGTVSAAARRALETDLTMPPTRQGGGLEAATPVRYVGRVLGALWCRWAVDAQICSASMSVLLGAAATACAPSVGAVIDHRDTMRAPDEAACGLIGTSDALNEVRRSIRRAARTPFPVLIEGESGSGKELVARAVYRLGARGGGRFCPLNCAALSDDLLEAELFGHTRGAFTGATSDRPGLFEEANKGVLLLDEVSELSPRGQAKLLRAIQEGEIRRVGENIARRIDVRLIAATNRSLAAEVDAGRFRRDLAYRLDVIRIVVPPLRERVEDIPTLAAHFWSQATRQIASRATLARATVGALARHGWPGNVRELQNVMTALAVGAPRRGQVVPRDLPLAISGAAPGPVSRLDDARRTFERCYVRGAMARAGGHRGHAASALGLSRQGFAKLMKRLALD